MRVLFDHSAPLPLRQYLRTHEIVTAVDRGWQALGDMKLLETAEVAGLELLITADKAFENEQRLAGRRIAVLVLSGGNWPDVRLNVGRLLAAMDRCRPGTATLVDCLTA